MSSKAGANKGEEAHCGAGKHESPRTVLVKDGADDAAAEEENEELLRTRDKKNQHMIDCLNVTLVVAYLNAANPSDGGCRKPSPLSFVAGLKGAKRVYKSYVMGISPNIIYNGERANVLRERKRRFKQQQTYQKQ